MFIQAISRRNINKWHAIPADSSTLPMLLAAMCGAPVINPGQHRWEFHATDDGTNRTWGACKRCAQIVGSK